MSLGVGIRLKMLPTSKGKPEKNANHARAWPGRQTRGDVAATCVCVICGSPSLLRCDTPRAMTFAGWQAGLQPWPRLLMILLNASPPVPEHFAPRSRSMVPLRRFRVCSGSRKHEHRCTQIRRDAHRWYALPGHRTRAGANVGAAQHLRYPFLSACIRVSTSLSRWRHTPMLAKEYEAEKQRQEAVGVRQIALFARVGRSGRFHA